ncbi:helix-turn-helix domain-containing protein [Thioclava sp. SK-1]|uniref:helix-turn-helix domain-containing protein n=1 Tax=Thioclava sp. SK-1 TaxID=1889770 RepID=UPI00159F04D5|nr:helix-turn-helix transcriptional regulator [Thioclava sp. SK-1]
MNAHRVDDNAHAIRKPIPDPWIHLAWITAGATPLKAWRHAADLTPQELATMAGISTALLTRLENRLQPMTVTQRLRFARLLGVSEGDLTE